MFSKNPISFPFKFPIPGPISGPIVGVLIGGAKKLWDKVMYSESAKEIAEKDRLNQENIDDVISYNRLLNEFIKEIEVDTHSFEEKIILECTQYYEELILLTKAVENEKDINLKSANIKRAVERLKRDASGSLAKSLYRNISLDNSDFKKILSLPAGQLKKDRLQIFKEEVIRKVLDDFINDLKVSIDDLRYDISGQLNILISDARKNNEMLLNELTILENAKENGENLDKLIELAESKIVLSNEILNVLRM